MANNVQNTINIEHGGQEYIKSFIEKIRNIKRNNDSIHLLYEDSEETREWWETNIGAKWAYIEDFTYDDTTAEITIVSAWSAVTPFVEFINEQTNNETTINFTYVDEMPNFLGRITYEKGDIVDEYDEPDMWSLIEEESDLRMKREDKTFSTESDKTDWMWDWMWDFVYETLENGSHV